MINISKPRCYCLAGAIAALGLISLVDFAAHARGLAGFARAALPASEPARQDQTNGLEPWTASQTEQPAALVKELANSKQKKPLAVCVGFLALYEGGHIPGASFHGPTSTPQGLDDLKKWAQSVPRDQSIVIYCGCCPMAKCPNVRPAFKTLQEMGFKQVKVLVIENTFASDWAQKGYPVQKGK